MFYMNLLHTTIIALNLNKTKELRNELYDKVSNK